MVKRSDITQICSLVSLVVSAALVVYGFMLILKDRQANEDSNGQISRQLRGLAFLLLGSVYVPALLTSACSGLFGAVNKAYRKM